MDASERGNLLNKLADLIERDRVYIAVSLPWIAENVSIYETVELLFIFMATEPRDVGQRKTLFDVLQCWRSNVC